MAYNISWMNNVTNFGDIMVGVNTASDNGLSIMVMLLVFIITYAASIKYGATSGMIASGLTTTIVGVLLWLIGVSEITWVVSAPIVVLVLGLAISFFNR